ncbi:hypothetical protein CXB51_023980 [Gossypium anomalum]|uniref:DUF7745 domain-containing protein n=1 Tax=Gossypium anomalum TaxID=47600 RepID=A0A8J5YJF6_9ROSI|nr:hypothetical protein CXB51_023980 [Gossypium anomalum]
MENRLLDRVEGNANVHRWSEQTQLEKGDSISVGYMSELSDYTRISVTQNNLQELKEIWDQWGNETKQLFYDNYGDLPYLLDVQVNEHLFRALAQFWNPAYSCFTFGEVDLVPTVEEYTALLRCPRFEIDRVYSRAACVPTFWKKLMTITGMSEQWITARIKEKGECKCISWNTLKDLILTHPDEMKKVDVFALGLYGLMVFPRALGYVDEATTNLFHPLSKRVTSVPVILAETFRSLGACRRAGAASVVCRVFFEDYSPLKDIVASTKRVDVPEKNRIALLQNLQSKDGYHWLRLFARAKAVRIKIVRLKVSSYTREPITRGRGKRINDNIPKPNVERARSIEEYLRVMPSELEIMKQEFERKNLELEKRIAKLEEEKMYLKLNVNVQKMEVEKERKEKRKIEEDRDDLKEHYKKAQEKRFQEMQSQNLALEEENKGLKTKVTELGRSLHWHRNRDSTVELKELKSKVEGLEVALHDGKLRIEQLEAREDYLKEELHQSRG